MRQQVTEVETPEPSNQATEERAICTPVETKKPDVKQSVGQEVTKVKTSEPSKQATEETAIHTAVETKKSGVNQSMGQEVIDIETSKPTKEVTEKAATCIVVENSDSDSTSMLSGKRKPDVDDGLELKEDVYRLRRKLRKLEERVAALESKKATDGQTDKISKLIDHLAETDVQSILTTLAKELFSEDTLINCSRTGKKTSKCSGTPRPPLDAEKLLQLETIVRKKTKISKETFHKKLENLQKTLRQKRKLF